MHGIGSGEVKRERGGFIDLSSLTFLLLLEQKKGGGDPNRFPHLVFHSIIETKIERERKLEREEEEREIKRGKRGRENPSHNFPYL